MEKTSDWTNLLLGIPQGSILGPILVVMDGTMAQFFFKPEKNLEFFRLKNLCHRCLSW